MTNHDTWVRLKPGNPLEPLAYIFPEGIPMRDPFPMERGKDGTVLWIIDSERLYVAQVNAICNLIAEIKKVDKDDVMHECMANGGLAIAHEWVDLDSMSGGSECYQRSQEFLNFLESHQEPTTEQWQEFYKGQIARWIEGDEQPQPINSMADIDPRLQLEAQQEALFAFQRGMSFLIPSPDDDWSLVSN
ncbi:MAG TPA: hypothetical protein VK203_27485 [Nostocaceae cyanobacterium]|nr:hypothetical protein [Nostocaceae cyanobacterium]